MKSPAKDWLGLVGGAMAMGAVVFGLGLFLLGSSSPKPAAGKEEKEAKVEEKVDEHTKEEKGHGEKKPAAPKKKEEKEKKETDVKEGEDTEHAKENKEGKGKEGKGEGKEPKEDKSPKYPTRDPKVQMEEWIGEGEKAMSYGNALEACEKFNMAYKLVPDGKGLDDVRALALLRLADATRVNDTIAAQRRSERALELYSRLMADYATSPQAESAQFQVGYCYEELAQFGEAEQAFDRFVALYPHSEKVPEARLSQAANQIVVGDPFKAKKLLQALLKQTLTPDTRSRALARIAQADLMIARQGQLPDEAAMARAEAVQIRETPKATVKTQEAPAPEANNTSNKEDNSSRSFVFNPLAMKKIPLAIAETPARKTTPEKKVDLKLLSEDDQKELAAIKPPSVPEEQWMRITRSLDTGNLKEASHLMKMYLDEKDPQNGLNAQQYLAWARVLRKVAERKVTDSPAPAPKPDSSPVAEDIHP